MVKVAKLVILILSVLLALSVFFVVMTFNQKRSLEQTNKTLTDQVSQSESRELKLLQEAKNLETQIKEAQTEKSKLEKDVADLDKKITTLNNQLVQMTTERDDWKNRLDSLKKERDELMTKLQEKPVPQPIKETPLSPQPPSVATSLEKDETYWAQVLREKAALQVQLDDLKNQLSKNAVLTEELKSKNSELELEIGSFKNDRTEIERKVKYAEDLAGNLSLELARAKNERKFLNDRLEQLDEQNVALRTQIKGLTTTKIAFEKSLARLVEEKNAVEKKLIETENVIQQRIDEIWQIKGSLDKRVATTKASSQEVELPPIIVKAQGPVVPEKVDSAPGGVSGFQGRILSINHENNFVVVDLGEKSGLQIGDALNVYRNSKYIAGLEVIQVRKDIAAADIKDKADQIKVGDLVR